MVAVAFSLGEIYWEDFELQNEDLEFLYNYLLELETPQSTLELVGALAAERIRREKQAFEKKRITGADIFQPKNLYTSGQSLTFPAINWQQGRVIETRPGKNPDLGEFQVLQVEFENGEVRQFASQLENHVLNQPFQLVEDDPAATVPWVMENYSDLLAEDLEQELSTNPDFVQIARSWFPRALLVDVHEGHLNLAEAVLDMASGGPLPTTTLLDQIGLSGDNNPKLLEFSLDLALQEDPRFDEVGPSGEILWYLHRLEPPEVLEPPLYLRYSGIDYDRTILTKEMLALEKALDDELSPIAEKYANLNEVEISLIYPHWRAGTLPLSARLRHLFPTAYEAPRIRFTLVDGDSGEKFPGWVVREKRYVFGLKNWFASHGVAPGSVIRVKRGKLPGEVIVKAEGRRANREWIRTVLVGSDGGIVYAMLKQLVSTALDERMAIAVPDPEAVDAIWNRPPKEQPGFEQLVTNTVRELARLNPQSHVHASELYAALNIVRRCPPAPFLGLLATNPAFVHVGDLHYRYGGAENE
jgi:hypothetical protein